MNKKYLYILPFALSALVAPFNASADEKKDLSQFTKEQQEAMEKASTPGEEHKILAQFEGEWSYASRWWMDAEAKPDVAEGKSDNKMFMGGRFLKQNHTGTAMGKPFEGVSITGYDNIKKHFSTIWIDNHSTAMATGVGKFDRLSNKLIDKGSFSGPMTKDGIREYRAEWTLPKDGSYTYEMYTAGENGKEFRTMEIVYKK